MSHRVVALYRDRPVGRFHGPFASHVAVIVLHSGRVQCRGWGLRVDAEAALERARQRERRLLYAEVHETQPDPHGRQVPLVREVPPDPVSVRQRLEPGAVAGVAHDVVSAGAGRRRARPA